MHVRKQEVWLGILLKVVVGVCCSLVVFAASGCAPRGAAVGDTQTTQAPAHDNMSGTQITVALIGSVQAHSDSMIADALSNAAIAVAYTSIQTLTDPAAGAQQAVRDAVNRHVQAIMINEYEQDEHTASAWQDALQDARNAGIPVILCNPINEPNNELLYAAVFRINDRMMDTEPIGKATKTVIFDEPHERDITVSTLNSESVER